MQASFGVNLYDKDGDVVEEGIYLFFETTSIRVAEGVDEFKEFLNHLNSMVTEIEEECKSVGL
jgi:hypothetical protein